MKEEDLEDVISVIIHHHVMRRSRRCSQCDDAIYCCCCCSLAALFFPMTATATWATTCTQRAPTRTTPVCLRSRPSSNRSLSASFLLSPRTSSPSTRSWLKSLSPPRLGNWPMTPPILSTWLKRTTMWVIVELCTCFWYRFCCCCICCFLVLSEMNNCVSFRHD